MQGTVLDLIVVMVILSVTMIGLVFGLLLYNKFIENDAWPDTEVGNATKAAATASLDVINYGMVFLMMGLIASLAIGAYFLNANPIFIIASLIMLLVVVVVSAPISNAIMEMMTSSSLSDEASNYDVATHVIGNFPIIVVIAGFLIIIALYAKPSGGGGV